MGPRHEARMKAFDAARYAMEKNIAMEAVARERGLQRETIQRASIILRHGTPEEIAQVEADEHGIASMADKVWKRLPPEARIRRTGFSVARPENLARRANSVAGARLVLDEHISILEASKRVGANTPSIQQALVVLKHGTQEEIKQLSEAAPALKVLWRTVRARLPDVAEQNADDRIVWDRLVAAFDAIVAMPRPHDVIGAIRRHHIRTERVERQLGPVYAWLEEFSDAWTK